MKAALAAMLAALALSACSANRDDQQAAATTAPTTTTTAPTTTTARATASELGKTQIHDANDGTFKARGKVTALTFTDNALIPAYRNDPGAAPRIGFRYAALQVRVCIVSSNIPGGATVSWAPWNLTSKDGDTYEPADSYSTDTLISPLYPNDDKATAVGQCRKGWIPFAVPNGWKPDSVEYIPEIGDTLTWQL